MRHALVSLSAACVLALAACAGTTLLDTETLAMRSVTAARQVATVSLRAGKITVAEDQKFQADLTVMATAIKAAVAANNQPAAMAQKAKADELKANLEKK